MLVQILMNNNYSSIPPLTLITEQEIVKLEGILREIPETWQITSISGELSTFLIASGEVDRSRAARDWLLDELRKKSPGPVVCRDVDLLFHPTLNLDPLVLFRQASRQVKLVVLWPGNYSNGVISYAVPEHRHYRFWKDLQDIDIKGVNDALQ